LLSFLEFVHEHAKNKFDLDKYREKAKIVEKVATCKKTGKALRGEILEVLGKFSEKLSAEETAAIQKFVNDINTLLEKENPSLEEIEQIANSWKNSAEHKKAEKFEYKNVVKITSHSEYLEKIKIASEENKLVVVDFFAVWCGPCVRIAPKFADWSEEFPNVVFLKVDVDQLRETSESAVITCMPTFKFYKKGEVVKTIEGASTTEIVAAIKELQ